MSETVTATTNWLDSKSHARQVHKILGDAWWEAYRKDSKSEETRMLRSALGKVVAEAKLKFGDNSRHPDCEYCLEVSVFGGPDHDPSSGCRSGKRPHCTCDTCF